MKVSRSWRLLKRVDYVMAGMIVGMVLAVAIFVGAYFAVTYFFK